MFQPKKWELRVTAAPRIPRGTSYLNSLRKILLLVESFSDINAIPEIEGTQSKATLEHLCVRLRPLGFFSKESTKYKWLLSDFSKHWLDSGNNEELAYFIDTQMQFFSELIELTKTPKKIGELLEDAKHKYRLMWKDNTQIYDRLHWLMDLGYVEHIDYKNIYLATPNGLAYLAKYPSYDYRNIVELTDFTTENDLQLRQSEQSLVELDKEELKSRKRSLGYSPGNTREILYVIINYLSLFSSGAKKLDLINNFSEVNYHIAHSSTRTFLTHLKHSGLIEQVSSTDYELTALGEEFLSSPSIEGLACIYHSKFQYFFEILSELVHKEMTVNELSVLSVIKYDFELENIPEIRKRLNILELANFVYRRKNHYFLTNKAKKILSIATVQEASIQSQEAQPNEEGEEPHQFSVQQLILELRAAARDSANPSRLEKGVGAVFEYLGFQSKWIGGSGNTDVLIQPKVAPAFSYKVNIDAKSTYSGTITDALVDFDTLAEHKRKHDSDYVIVVGIDFKNDRLITRAKEHGVGLLDVETLAHLLIQHDSVPISFSMYRLLFEQSGIVELSVLEPEFNQAYRRAKLLKSITECLYDNTDDEFTKGMMTQRDIYFVLKNSSEPQLKDVSPEEIEEALLFLSSPYVDCIGRDLKNGFYAKGALPDAVQKFQFYANQLR